MREKLAQPIVHWQYRREERHKEAEVIPLTRTGLGLGVKVTVNTWLHNIQDQ